MQKISTCNLRPGMIVALNIYNANGNKLLTKGTILNKTYIDRLNALYIPGIYVSLGNPTLDINTPEDILKESVRVEATRTLYRAFQKCQLTEDLDTKSLTDTTNMIIDNLLHNSNNIIQMTEIRKFDTYTFSHSISVCVLSTIIGILKQYSKKRLYEIAFGALLHDIGKLKIPLEILNKNGRLTTEEMNVMKKHSELGFFLLRKNKNLSVVPMHVAFQHHEKYDGSGYPRGVKGKAIHEYARVVAIADVYDALTSDRPYKSSVPPYEAYKIMVKESGNHFDPDILELFFEHVAIFPVGTTVKLNDGSFGIVTEIEVRKTFTPKVKLIATSKKIAISENISVDLSVEPNLYIEKSLDENEIFDLMKTTFNIKFSDN
ncbi:HD-GYP domain-containing protein [Anaerosinus gibii]|uniref:HD-GYP domain-containing protein n=1 Tax=Selenobaculum gibii TaxID=3054208 RepID=A0A9Y2AF32_9FIRM|nr:HD-GYP domain-containing protein [Selenobaculum gbiensis]WIW70420.1 HD-GYP domain-containing protein [Selenobaculum gbiensis]